MAPLAHVVIRGGYGTVGKTVVRAFARGLSQCRRPLGLSLMPEELFARTQFSIIGHSANIHQAADMIRKDSTHGFFEGSISVREKDGIIDINGKPFRYQQAGIEQIEWEQNAVRIMIEGVGDIKDAKKGDTDKALRSEKNPNGADLMTATTTLKGARNFIVGLNEWTMDPLVKAIADGSETGVNRAFGSGSCTTNCSLPVLVVANQFMEDTELADLTTVHSRTGSQSNVDKPAKNPERGRDAGQNVIFTSTNAAELKKVFPEAFAEVDGAIAIRGPWAEGSVVKLILEGKIKDPNMTIADINAIYQNASASGELSGVLGYVPVGDIRGSSDFIVDPHSSTFDANYTTLKLLGKYGDNVARVKLHSWYANAYAVPHRATELVWRAIAVLASQQPIEIQ